MSTEMSTKIRYFGVLNDANLAPSGILYDRGANIIVIESLRHAELILDGTMVHGDPSRWVAANDLDGEPHGRTPALSAPTLTLWHAETDTERAAEYWTDFYGPRGIVTDPYPEYVLSVGPRGGIKRERA